MQIYTLQGLRDAALNKQSVVCPKLHNWIKPRPAAFVIGLMGKDLVRMIESGMHVYQKKA